MAPGTTHPPFGHLLPDGEKGMVIPLAERVGYSPFVPGNKEGRSTSWDEAAGLVRSHEW